jgi:hypothetical protein
MKKYIENQNIPPKIREEMLKDLQAQELMLALSLLISLVSIIGLAICIS